MSVHSITQSATQSDVITSKACAQMVESATRACQPMISVPPEPANSTADALAGLSTAFTYGSMVFAILAVIAGFAWAKHVAHEAKEMAKENAKNYIESWLAEKAPGIIRERVEFIVDATLGSGDDATAADDLGEAQDDRS